VALIRDKKPPSPISTILQDAEANIIEVADEDELTVLQERRLAINGVYTQASEMAE
jgi:hypothetical protein